MNRMYTFAYAKQPVGRARYVLMTDQTGAVMDDGVACRITDQHFYVTATTSGVDGVYRSMLRWNAQWRLQVDVANVTAAYAGVNLAGPKSRAVLEKLVQDIDLSAQAFPYMGVFEAQVAGIPARLLRVGFVGELGYEIHVPASPRGYPVPRQDTHAWFAITGQHAPAMFAKLCGVDLRAHKFPDNTIAQTSVARLSTIVIRHDLGDTPGYYALCDSASAGYFWDRLMDAMAEFRGDPIGLATLRALAKG